jgi:hypothetical protein
MLGEDGSMYHFLLKGHEDLRQDERAMQVGHSKPNQTKNKTKQRKNQTKSQT